MLICPSVSGVGIAASKKLSLSYKNFSYNPMQIYAAETYSTRPSETV